MPETITVNLSSYPENLQVNLTTESSGVTANLVETTLTFLEGAGLYRENVFTQDNTFQKDVYVGENLTVAGAISASQYLNLPSISGDYLPLSGGTITGNLYVTGTTVIPHISGNTALSGNLTVTGDTAITGNLSVTGGASVDNVTFDLTPELAGGVGIMRWNNTDGTVDLGLKGGNVTLQVGQEFVARVVNKTGANLLESQYRVVRIRLASEGGAQGQRLAVVLAQGNNDPDSTTTLGVVTENIDNNQEGFITIMGQVRGINTTGSLQGETWVDGDVLYLSPTAAGQLTKFKPTAPQHSVTVAYVEYAHQNQGKLFVKVDNGYELDELHNVRITDVQEADVLTYDSTLSVWKNAPSGGGDYLPLAGGTVTGALVVQDGFTSSGDETLIGGVNFTVDNTNTVIDSTNSLSVTTPTVIFNATSGVSINGSLTASGIVTSPDFSLTGTIGGELVASKSVACWAYANKTTPLLTNDAAPQAVFFKPDGSRMYVLGSGGPTTYRVYSYIVPTPWDVSTVSAAATLSSVVIDQAMQGLYFSPDGRYFFTLSSLNRTVRRYAMPVGSEWNVSTGVLSGSFTFPSTTWILRGIYFKPDGTKMYVAEDFTNFVYEYNLTTAWDVTTAVVPAGSPSVSIFDGGADISISSDGKRLILITGNNGGVPNFIWEYSLPTPWSLVGAFWSARMFRTTNTTVFPAGGPAVQENASTGIYYNDVSNKCFFLGTQQRRVQEIDVTPQPAIVGKRPIILSTVANSAADRVTMNSLQLTDTTSTVSGTTGALIVAGGIAAGGAVNTPVLNAANVQATGTDSGIITLQFRGSIRTAGSGNDGCMRLGNETGTDFNRLILGPFTEAYPAIVRNGNGIDIRSAPLSGGFTDIRVRSLSATGPITFPSSTVANLTGFPPASYTGAMVYVSNESGGATMAFSNGTNWLRVQDRAIVT